MFTYIAQRIKGFLPNVYYIILIFIWPTKLIAIRKKEYIDGVIKKNGLEEYGKKKDYWDKSFKEQSGSIYIYRNSMIWGILKMILVVSMAYYSAMYAKQFMSYIIQPYIINNIKIIGVCLVFLGVSGKVNTAGIQTSGNNSIPERANNAWNRYLYLLGIYLSLTTFLI